MRQEIEQFLYQEARLLDSGLFHEWLALFTDDVKYWMPARENLPAAVKPVDEGDLAYALYDEDLASLTLRVRRLDTGLARVEEPRSITRHMVSNVLVDDRDGDNAVKVDSNFLVFQLRHGQHESFFVGRREDVLRRVDSDWKIAKRKIHLDQLVLPRAVSIFF
jgi:3-phenylpropionate/cinnamic acid dioxygenase small subunit